MKHAVKTFFLTLALSTLHAKSDELAPTAGKGIPAGVLSVKVVPWQSPCRDFPEGQAARCDIPQAFPGVVESEVALDIKAVSSPAQSAYSNRKVVIEGGPTYELGVYSVYPAESSGFPPYLQIRVEFTSPVRAVCIQSVRYREVFEAPPVICVGFESGEHARQVGITLRDWAIKRD